MDGFKGSRVKEYLQGGVGGENRKVVKKFDALALEWCVWKVGTIRIEYAVWWGWKV